MDILTKQQAVAKARQSREQRQVLVFFLVWALLLIGVRDHSREFWVSVVVLTVFHGRNIFCWLRSRSWMKSLTEACGGGETALTVVCTKAQLITHKDSRYTPRNLEAVRLITDSKEVYLYILPEPVVYNGRVRETVNGACIGQSTSIICYAGTHMVKEVAHLTTEDMTWE